MEAYADANYAGSLVDRRPTTGYCMFLDGKLVTWRSKKQTVDTRSIAVLKFRAMKHGICEVLWLKIILNYLKIKREWSMKLYCDNKSAISIAHNLIQHDPTKHIDIDRHFIKEKLKSSLVTIPYVSSSNKLVDVLTEGCLQHGFKKLLAS